MRFVDQLTLDQAYVENVAAVYGAEAEHERAHRDRGNVRSPRMDPRVRLALRLAGGDYRRLRWDRGDVVVENRPRA